MPTSDRCPTCHQSWLQHYSETDETLMLGWWVEPTYGQGSPVWLVCPFVDDAT